MRQEPIIASAHRALVVLFVVVVAAIFLRRSFNTVAEKSGIHMFATAGLLLLIGAVLTVIWVARADTAGHGILRDKNIPNSAADNNNLLITSTRYSQEARALFLADGEAAFQDVFHVHLHVIPRFRGDGFGLQLPPSYDIKPERKELDRIAEQIRKAISK